MGERYVKHKVDREPVQSPLGDKRLILRCQMRAQQPCWHRFLSDVLYRFSHRLVQFYEKQPRPVALWSATSRWSSVIKSTVVVSNQFFNGLWEVLSQSCPGSPMYACLSPLPVFHYGGVACL